jgi:hypothetical protein
MYIVGIYIDNCRFEIQKHKEVPVWYTGIWCVGPFGALYLPHIIQLNFLCSVNTWLTNSVAPEPAGSSPYLQETAIGHYPEPSGFTPPLPVSLRSILIPSSFTLWSSKWSLSFGLSHQNPVHVLSHARHMSRPPDSQWILDELNIRIYWSLKETVAVLCSELSSGMYCRVK